MSHNILRQNQKQMPPQKTRLRFEIQQIFFGVSFFQTAHFLWVSARARKIAHHNDAREHIIVLDENEYAVKMTGQRAGQSVEATAKATALNC